MIVTPAPRCWCNFAIAKEICHQGMRVTDEPHSAMNFHRVDNRRQPMRRIGKPPLKKDAVENIGQWDKRE